MWDLRSETHKIEDQKSFYDFQSSIFDSSESSLCLFSPLLPTFTVIREK
ncbi:hypothetical protein RV11_GL001818 [Enterococcus phoeniculicola]|nr:hypothetical protein RV11_GL001818 [Enterococcus phoeniculicola]